MLKEMPHYVVYEEDRYLTGQDAINFAREHGFGWIEKYADPIEGAGAVTIEDAIQIAKVDPSLIHFDIVDEEGTPVPMPVRNEVCWRCEGNGKHTNPSIDGNGLSAEDFAEDPDFMEDYMRGVYDVTCHECKGRRVLEVVDLEANLTDQQKEAVKNYNDWWDDEMQNRAERAAERRMGC